MSGYSNASLKRLETCHSDLQLLFKEVINYCDNIVLIGYRGEEEQNQAVLEGRSKLKFPLSNHNSLPSMAVDIAPYPVDWNNTKSFYYFAGFVKGIAEKLLKEGTISHKIRWGGDWDSDNDFKDNTFNDLVHFELVPIKAN